jgi:type VI secretion system secreted protein VgrG
MSLLSQAAQAFGGPASKLSDLSSLLASFASAFTQKTRILRVYFSADSGIAEDKFLPHVLTGHEEINGDFHYELELLSSDDNVELKSILGNPVMVTILTDTCAEREICGLVLGVRQEGSDGGFAKYRIIIESALSALKHRITARVFNNLDARALTRQIIGEHLENNPILAASFKLDDRCSLDYPARAFRMQYNEPDEAYLRRLWAHEGISYVIEPAPESTQDHPQHVLVLFDDPYVLDPNPAGTVRFHRADGTEQYDAITEWKAHRTLQSGSVSRTSWNHANASVHGTSEGSQSDQGEYGNDLASSLDDYRHEPHLEEHGPDPFEDLGPRRVQVKEQRTKYFEGESSVRFFQAGTWFSLIQHPVQDQDDPQDRDFVITRLETEAFNNLPKDLQGGLSGLLGGERDPHELPYTNRFTCLRRGIPTYAEEIKPPVPGILTARVVGPSNSVVHTDELGRIKIRFLFTRPEEHPDGGASDTDADSAWVRQSEVWSSRDFGGNFIPRVGDEVLVQFLGDDPDKPIVVGSTYNGVKPPASFQNVSGLPLDKTMSGIRSQMHHGMGSNELIFDDTHHELRTKFSSDHEKSQLSLGHLVHPRSKADATPKGEGFELRTDAWGAMRAEKGLLISTDGREDASGQHLDPKELVNQTQASIDLTKALSDASENHQAGSLAANETTKQLKKNAEATKNYPNGKADEKVAAFDKSILGLSSPAGIVEGTPGTIVKSTGKKFHIATGGDANFAIGRKFAMAIQDAWSALAMTGIKLFAGKGDVAIEAHEGNIEITGEKETKLIACNQGIDLASPSKATLTAGGCQVELSGGSMTFKAPKNVNCKAKWNVVMPMPKTYEMPHLAKEGDVQDHGFFIHDGNNNPRPSVRYEMVTPEGKIHKGYTDTNGLTDRVATRNPAAVKIKLFDN